MVGTCTTAAGVCTTPAMPPLFGAYGHYEVVVTPGDATHGQRIVTTELTPGTAAQVVTVPGVPLLPVVTVQPAAQTAWAGDPATFSATATGSRPFTAQWQVSTDGGTNWADITGATQTVTPPGAANVAATVSTTVATIAAADDGHQYRVFLTNGGDNGDTRQRDEQRGAAHRARPRRPSAATRRASPSPQGRPPR